MNESLTFDAVKDNDVVGLPNKHYNRIAGVDVGEVGVDNKPFNPLRILNKDNNCRSLVLKPLDPNLRFFSLTEIEFNVLEFKKMVVG